MSNWYEPAVGGPNPNIGLPIVGVPRRAGDASAHDNPFVSETPDGATEWRVVLRGTCPDTEAGLEAVRTSLRKVFDSEHSVHLLEARAGGQVQLTSIAMSNGTAEHLRGVEAGERDNFGTEPGYRGAACWPPMAGRDFDGNAESAT